MMQRKTVGRIPGTVPGWASLTLLVLFGTGPVLADRYEDEIKRATEARARGDMATAIKALDAARASLTRSASAAQPGVSTGSAPEEMPATPPKEDPTVFERLSDEGFRLQLGPGKSGDDAQAATFGFSEDRVKDTGTQFSAAFLLGYSPNSKVQGLINLGTGDPVKLRRGATELGGPNTTWAWDMSVQGSLQPGNDDKADAWVFRFGGDIDHTNPTEFATFREYRKVLRELRAQGLSDAALTTAAHDRLSRWQALLLSIELVELLCEVGGRQELRQPAGLLRGDRRPILFHPRQRHLLAGHLELAGCAVSPNLESLPGSGRRWTDRLGRHHRCGGRHPEGFR